MPITNSKGLYYFTQYFSLENKYINEKDLEKKKNKINK